MAMATRSRSHRNVISSEASAAVIRRVLRPSPIKSFNSIPASEKTKTAAKNEPESSKRRKTAATSLSSSSVTTLLANHPLEEETEEDVEKLIEGLAKNSLVLLAKEIVSKYPNLTDESVRKLAVFNPALRKIVVRGLDHNTTAQTLTSVFRECGGEIEDYYMAPPAIFFGLRRRSAWANILFKRRSGALKAIKKTYKIIDNKNTYCTLESLGSDTNSLLLTVPPSYDKMLPSQNQSPLIEEEEEEPVEKIIEGFGREYLLFFVKEAVSKYPDLIKTVHKLADLDPRLKQVMVSNLRVMTSAHVLRIFFGKYGEVEKVLCIEDFVIESNHGCVCVVFKHRDGAQKAVKESYQKSAFGICGDIFCRAPLLNGCSI